jgi:hypothetical protein
VNHVAIAKMMRGEFSAVETLGKIAICVLRCYRIASLIFRRARPAEFIVSSQAAPIQRVGGQTKTNTPALSHLSLSISELRNQTLLHLNSSEAGFALHSAE